MKKESQFSKRKKVLIWMGSSWRRKCLPGMATDQIWRKINDISVYEEHARQISSHKYIWDRNLEVPEHIHASMCGLWLVELFPSSLSTTLFNEFNHSGWDGIRAYAMNEESNAEKARGARAKNEVRWWRVGCDIDKSSHTGFFDGVPLDLPNEFEFVEYKAIQIGSSLTAVSAFFMPTEETKAQLDIEWHKCHEPVLLRERGRRPKALGRRSSDIRAIHLVRSGVYESARKWMSKRCGGFFSQKGLKAPAADCLLFEGFDPTTDVVDDEYLEAFRALGLDATYHWVSSEIPNLAIVPFDDFFDQFDYLGIVGDARRAAAPIEKYVEMYGGHRDRAIVRHYSEHIQDVLLQISIKNYTTAMLEIYAKRRDGAYQDYRKHGLKKTERLRFEMLSDSLDIKEAALDAGVLWKPIWRKWDGLEDLRLIKSPRLRMLDDESPDQNHDLLKEFESVSKQNFDLLINKDIVYRDILSTASSLGSDNINTKLSRIALIVACVSLVVAIVTPFFSLFHI